MEICGIGTAVTVVVFDGSKKRHGTKLPGLERASHSRHGLNDTGDERRLHFAHGVVDGDAPTFVENFHAEDLGRAHGTVFVGAGERDVEGQYLIGIPGSCRLLACACREQAVVQGIDGRADRRSGGANNRRGEYRSTISDVRIGWTDLIAVCNEGACTLLNQVQQLVTIEVDPDQAAGDTTLVA